MKQKKVIINNDIKLNYIRHFICRNLNKIICPRITKGAPRINVNL